MDYDAQILQVLQQIESGVSSISAVVQLIGQNWFPITCTLIAALVAVTIVKWVIKL